MNKEKDKLMSHIKKGITLIHRTCLTIWSSHIHIVLSRTLMVRRAMIRRGLGSTDTIQSWNLIINSRTLVLIILWCSKADLKVATWEKRSRSVNSNTICTLRMIMEQMGTPSGTILGYKTLKRIRCTGSILWIWWNPTVITTKEWNLWSTQLRMPKQSRLAGSVTASTYRITRTQGESVATIWILKLTQAHQLLQIVHSVGWVVQLPQLQGTVPFTTRLLSKSNSVMIMTLCSSHTATLTLILINVNL